MHIQAALLSVVMALDGESVGGGNSTGVAVVAAISMVSGYVLLAALWWFVFRDKARAARRKRERSERDRPGGLSGRG